MKFKVLQWLGTNALALGWDSLLRNSNAKLHLLKVFADELLGFEIFRFQRLFTCSPSHRSGTHFNSGGRDESFPSHPPTRMSEISKSSIYTIYRDLVYTPDLLVASSLHRASGGRDGRHLNLFPLTDTSCLHCVWNTFLYSPSNWCQRSFFFIPDPDERIHFNPNLNCFIFFNPTKRNYSLKMIPEPLLETGACSSSRSWNRS